MPFFSVIIPLYNKENFIANTLKSVLLQTFADFEVVIVNDCSTDQSVAAVQQINDPRIRIVVHEKNKGLSASRNTGIKNANSKYVALIDADDLWKPDFLATIYEMIVRYPDAGLFATKYEEVYPGNKIIEHKIPDVFNDKKTVTGIVNYFTASLNKAIYCSSCICIDKKVFEKAGYYDASISFGEDTDFNIRANYYFSLAYCSTPLAHYIMHTQNQITGSGLHNKTIPDYAKYEPLADGRPDIKKFLDFHRYAKAKMYKLSGDRVNYKKLKNEISPASLNIKQRLLLSAPLFVIKTVSAIKNSLLKKGVVVNSYN